MDENRPNEYDENERFDENEPVREYYEDDVKLFDPEADPPVDHTRELNSISGEDGTGHGITPREEFSELNAADDEMGKTRLMNAITDEEAPSPAPVSASEAPVKRRKKRKKHRTNHTRTMGHIFLGVLLSVLSVVVAIFLSVKVIGAMKDFTGMAKKLVASEITITEDMGVGQITDALYTAGIIDVPWLFRTYLRLSDKETGFLAGDYELNSNMSYSNIAALLQTEKTYTEKVMIMIPEGYTAMQIGELLEENYVCRAVDFMAYYQSKLDEYDFEEGIPDDPTRFFMLEGYLFPDTYEFFVIDDLKKHPDFDTMQYAKRAAEKMYDNFETKITKPMEARMDELGMTLDEVIILASLIQWEGTNEENMAMVSSVFHNRLNKPDFLPWLQSDTTYTYIDTVINIAASGDVSAIIDAYDTYKCEGLPPGPICNPGIDAINAALYPADTDFYFFLASKDGVFYYAQTEEQHNQNIIDAALREEQ